MTHKAWIMAAAVTLTVTGLAFAQQQHAMVKPKAEPADKPVYFNQLNPVNTDGAPIKKIDQRPTARASYFNALTPVNTDGKPITGATTNFGAR